MCSQTHVQPAEHISFQDLASNPPRGKDWTRSSHAVEFRVFETAYATTENLCRDAIQEQNKLQVSCVFVTYKRSGTDIRESYSCLDPRRQDSGTDREGNVSRRTRSETSQCVRRNIN